MLVRNRSASVRLNSPPSSTSTPERTRSSAAFSPSASMSNRPRSARYLMRAATCAGHFCELGHRQSTSPSRWGASLVPQLGQFSGNTYSRSVPSRRSTTGPNTSGMISPALRITTVSPMSTPLRFTSV